MASTASSIRQKVNNSFISEESKALASDIGVEQRFVKNLLASQNNNYEEQYIQGVDKVSYSYFDNSIKYTGIKFLNEDVGAGTGGYYFLYIEDRSYRGRYYFDGEDLKLPPTNYSGSRFDGEVMVNESSNPDKYKFVGEDFQIEPYDEEEKIIRVETLYYRRDTSSDSFVPISTDRRISKKDVYYFYNQINNKTIVREVITNYL